MSTKRPYTLSESPSPTKSLSKSPLKSIAKRQKIDENSGLSDDDGCDSGSEAGSGKLDAPEFVDNSQVGYAIRLIKKAYHVIRQQYDEEVTAKEKKAFSDFCTSDLKGRYRTEGRAHQSFVYKKLILPPVIAVEMQTFEKARKRRNSRPKPSVKEAVNVLGKQVVKFNRIPQITPFPKMTYFTHIERSMVSEDNFRLSHVPYQDDTKTTISETVNNDMHTVFDEGIHGVVMNWNFINDYILYHMFKMIKPTDAPLLIPKGVKLKDDYGEYIQKIDDEQFAYALFCMFPNKLSYRSVPFLIRDLEDVFEKPIAEARSRDAINRRHDRRLDAIKDSYCVKCMEFHCRQHGYVTSNEITKPAFRERGVLVCHGEICSNKCFKRNRIEKNVNGVVRYEPPPVPIEEPSSFIDSVRLMSVFRTFMCTEEYDICQLLPRMNMLLGDLKMPLLNCEQLYYTSVVHGVDPTALRPKKKLTPKEIIHQQKAFRRLLLKDNNIVAHKKVLTACNHHGHCRENIGCPCFDRNICCTKDCGCEPSCARRFSGCRCSPGQCGTNLCPCLLAKWECDPDVCTSCCNGYAEDRRAVSGNDSSSSSLSSTLNSISGDPLQVVAELNNPPVTKRSSGKKEKRGRKPKRYQPLSANDLQQYSKDRHYFCKNTSIQRGVTKKVVVGISQISGWGLFLGESIERQGEFITEYVGEIITSGEAERRGLIYDLKGLSYIFDINDNILIDATRIGNLARFANHSENPNVEARVMVVNGDYRVAFYSKRRIEQGEELFFDYKYEMNCKRYVSKTMLKSKHKESDGDKAQRSHEMAATVATLSLNAPLYSGLSRRKDRLPSNGQNQLEEEDEENYQREDGYGLIQVKKEIKEELFSDEERDVGKAYEDRHYQPSDNIGEDDNEEYKEDAESDDDEFWDHSDVEYSYTEEEVFFDEVEDA